MRVSLIVLAALLALLTTAHGEPLTEQQARIKAAQWCEDPCLELTVPPLARQPTNRLRKF
jgi:hypothetical protein